MNFGTEPLALSSALAEATKGLHVQAERSGFIADMLRGAASRHGYALYLRNLLPAYQQLELGLERHRQAPALRGIALAEIYRSSALVGDLAGLWGDDWALELACLPVARRYADSIAAAAEDGGERLIGHAYVRYLGDLSGGQILKRLLSKSLDLPATSLTFYEFPQLADIGAFRLGFREALDRAADWIVDRQGVVEAARQAFLVNIEIAEAVRRAELEPQAGGA